MSLKSKIQDLGIDDSSKRFLTGCLDEDHSILNNPDANSLFYELINDVESDTGMLSFLMKLNDQPDDRYIKLPHYQSIRPRKLKENEMVLDEYGKYGILVNLVSNRKTFNFSVRLNDMTIIKYDYELRKQVRGSYRSYALTDKYGNIAKNWRTLKIFQMHETKKIFDNHDKHQIMTFDTFVGDQLGQKLLTIKYFLLKCYINRLVFERGYWKNLKESAEQRQMNGDFKFIKRETEEQIAMMKETQK